LWKASTKFLGWPRFRKLGAVFLDVLGVGQVQGDLGELVLELCPRHLLIVQCPYQIHKSLTPVFGFSSEMELGNKGLVPICSDVVQQVVVLIGVQPGIHSHGAAVTTDVAGLELEFVQKISSL
jgi:hypothetical protein